MQLPPPHIEALKHVGDIASASAVVAYWLGLLAGLAAPIATIASAVWFVFRAIDMYWTFMDRLKHKREKP